MPEDRSLDEFVGADEEADAAPDEEADAAPDEEADAAPDEGADAAPDEEADAASDEELHGETIESGGDEGRDESNGKTAVRDPGEVEPAVATFDWSPDGSECARCGSIVDRRWVDDGEYVCANCKEW